MAVTRFSARNNILLVSTSNNDATCKGASFLQCPQAIRGVAWAILLFAIIIFIWKIGASLRLYRKMTTGRSNSKEDHPPALPYPQPPYEIYEDVSTKKLGPNSSTSTLVDPFLITNSFDKSLISQDDSFKQMAMPEPVLKWRESVNHSALDLPERPEPMVVHPSELQLDPTIQPYDDDHKEPITSNFSDLRPASPPPAYVRTPHS